MSSTESRHPNDVMSNDVPLANSLDDQLPVADRSISVTLGSRCETMSTSCTDGNSR